jgi:uncharacterized iron-regulated membrane protein
MQIKKTLRKWLYLSHLWIGLILGLYFTLLGLTGSTLIFKPELNNYFDASARQVIVPRAGQRVALDAVVFAFRKLHPTEKISSLVLPEKNGDALSILYRSGGGKKQESRQVFINPYSGSVLSDETAGGEFFHFFKELHTRLLLEDLGKDIHRYGVLCIVVLLVSGIWLWWPSARHFKTRTTIKWDGKFKRVVFDTHNAVGFYSSSLLLLFALTAITALWRDQSMSVIGLVTQSRVLNEKKIKSADTSEVVSYSSCVANAEKALPGLTPLMVSADGKVMMSEADSHFVFPRLIAVKTNTQDGAVEKIERPENKTIGQQILNWAMPVHFGQWGPGPAYYLVKIVWFITGLCPLVLCISGFLMFFEKEKSKRQAREKKLGAAAAEKSSGSLTGKAAEAIDLSTH